MASDCGKWIAKFILFIINSLLFILGTCLLIIGAWLAIEKSSLIALLNVVENENIKQFVQPIVIEQFAYVFIGCGAILFLISFLGNWGSFIESRCLLSTYGVLMILLLVTEITACGLAIGYKEKVKNETQGYLKSTISNYYSIAKNPDAVTSMWNSIMTEFSCCGVNDYRDFNPSIYNQKINQTIPAVCCKMNQEQPDPSCLSLPNENNSYYKKGCYDAFIEFILQHRDVLLGVLLGITVIHLLVIFLTFCLCKSISKYHGMRL